MVREMGIGSLFETGFRCRSAPSEHPAHFTGNEQGLHADRKLRPGLRLHFLSGGVDLNRLPRWIQESVWVTSCFLVVFAGANFLTGLHGWRVPIHFSWEGKIPFLPQASLLYLTIGPTMAGVAFSLRQDASALIHFRRVLVAETLAAGAFFLLLPAELAPGFARSAPPPWSFWVAASAAMGMRYNLFPSLHVAFALSTAWHGSTRRSRMIRGLLFLWAGLVMVSTLVLHLHHVLDLAGGLLLAGMIEYRYRPILTCPQTAPSLPA